MYLFVRNIGKKIGKAIDRVLPQGYDFESHLIELGFSFKREKNGVKLYIHEDKVINIIWNTLTDDIHLYSGDKLYSKVNFVPNNPIFTENLIRKTIESVCVTIEKRGNIQ